MKEQAQSDAAIAQANAVTAQANEATAHADAASSQAALVANQSASTAAINAAQTDAANSQAAMVTNQNASTAAINAANANADQSRLVAQQAQDNEQKANSEKAAMRVQLAVQLNKILETRESARGLIISMSDVLFDTGKYSLMPGAREKLAKIAGILITYPGLNVEVGGYTDDVGSNEMNQKLSQNRAGAVRDYLVAEGVANNTVTSKGFGNSLPVASNDNSAGRQANRRVELVVSGEAIGSPVNTTTGSLR
jgi:outer membrane protein OmpA-like peptidoglycan-associated protein